MQSNINLSSVMHLNIEQECHIKHHGHCCMPSARIFFYFSSLPHPHTLSLSLPPLSLSPSISPSLSPPLSLPLSLPLSPSLSPLSPPPLSPPSLALSLSQPLWPFVNKKREYIFINVPLSLSSLQYNRWYTAFYTQEMTLTESLSTHLQQKKKKIDED